MVLRYAFVDLLATPFTMHFIRSQARASHLCESY